tara:strand:+ start:20300 stop:21073 length:774 start_codon:yes stop_codon:yes gene_type:complete
MKHIKYEVFKLEEMDDRQLELLVTGAGFASFLYTLGPSNKQAGAVKRITLNVGAKYRNVLQRSKLSLERIMECDLGAAIIEHPQDTPRIVFADQDQETMQEAAKREYLSILKAIKCHDEKISNSDYTKAGLYEAIDRAMPTNDGAALNVKRHKLDGTLEIGGLHHAEKLLKPSPLPHPAPRKSSPLVIARNTIRKQLSRSKWRTLAIENIALVKRQGEHLIFAPQTISEFGEFSSWDADAIQEMESQWNAVKATAAR